MSESVTVTEYDTRGMARAKILTDFIKLLRYSPLLIQAGHLFPHCLWPLKVKYSITLGSPGLSIYLHPISNIKL